jgi:hypothetical protein
MDNQQPSLYKCKVCGHEKPITEFHIYACKTRKTRVTDVCIPCHKDRLYKWYLERQRNLSDEQRQTRNEYSREYRKRDPERTKTKAKCFHAKYRERDRLLVYAHYGSTCACCGEKDRRFLTIDHVNNDGHVERKKGLYTNGSQFYRWIIQSNFPDDYQVLCYNCNLGKARNGGICPHQDGSTTISSESTAKRPEALTTL